jgi:hypothetical protein
MRFIIWLGMSFGCAVDDVLLDKAHGLPAGGAGAGQASTASARSS